MISTTHAHSDRLARRSWPAVPATALAACLVLVASAAHATAQIATANMDVSITITNACTVSANPLNFGSRGLLSTAVDATTTLSVTCSKNTNYSVSLDDGQNASSGVRRMALSGQYVSYALYQDSGRTTPWGSASSAQVSGAGTGAAQSITVYGRVPAQATPSAGTYLDTVVVSVSY